MGGGSAPEVSYVVPPPQRQQTGWLTPSREGGLQLSAPPVPFGQYWSPEKTQWGLPHRGPPLGIHATDSQGLWRQLDPGTALWAFFSRGPLFSAQQRF